MNQSEYCFFANIILRGKNFNKSIDRKLRVMVSLRIWRLNLSSRIYIGQKDDRVKSVNWLTMLLNYWFICYGYLGFFLQLNKNISV